MEFAEERKLPHSSGANAKDCYGIIYSTSFAGGSTLHHCGHPSCPDDTEHNDLIFASGDKLLFFIAGLLFARKPFTVVNLVQLKAAKGGLRFKGQRTVG